MSTPRAKRFADAQEDPPEFQAVHDAHSPLYSSFNLKNKKNNQDVAHIVTGGAAASKAGSFRSKRGAEIENRAYEILREKGMDLRKVLKQTESIRRKYGQNYGRGKQQLFSKTTHHQPDTGMVPLKPKTIKRTNTVDMSYSEALGKYQFRKLDGGAQISANRATPKARPAYNPKPRPRSAGPGTGKALSRTPTVEMSVNEAVGKYRFRKMDAGPQMSSNRPSPISKTRAGPPPTQQPQSASAGIGGKRLGRTNTIDMSVGEALKKHQFRKYDKGPQMGVSRNVASRHHNVKHHATTSATQSTQKKESHGQKIGRSRTPTVEMSVNEAIGKFQYRKFDSGPTQMSATRPARKAESEPRPPSNASSVKSPRQLRSKGRQKTIDMSVSEAVGKHQFRKLEHKACF